uniref:Sema domain-containing protein n=1 Tax=Denticeps clupeoides TaxID=299321 RepID=A0AAY4ESD4_9TELE
MASWLVLGLLLYSCACESVAENRRTFSSKTAINNVVQDPETGRLYVGAVNFIYQLDQALNQESSLETGPRKDNPQCTPPITPSCPDPKSMDNHNKLLLVHSTNGSLVVCGSLFRGICFLVNLTNINQVLFYSDSKGEKTYVASTEESMSVVGIMSTYTYERDNRTFVVFLVAKGCNSFDGSKLISTRVLQDYKDWVVFENVVETSTVQAGPFMQRYLHNFRYVFKDSSFVYFLFSRTTGMGDKVNFTFVARMCEKDSHYYSYTELQLNCSASNKYNKIQAAYVEAVGQELAQNMSASGQYGLVMPSEKVVFAVFSSDDDSSSSALCLYPLRLIDSKLKKVISACYNNKGKSTSGEVAVYTPYTGREDNPCTKNEKDMAENFKCGDEFLPSPLAGKAEFGLSTKEVYTRTGLLTAIAVSVENQHTVAFLGTKGGEVFKVRLPYHYGKVSGDNAGERINKNLLFDKDQSHLYITSKNTITKVPVQMCHLKTDCQSCMSLRDPYCGWCVLEGKCSRKSECKRGEETNVWLWSPKQQCVTIHAFQPPNLSCKMTGEVNMDIPALPKLNGLELACDFGQSREIAQVRNTRVTCKLPQPYLIPPTPVDQDFVAIEIKILVGDGIEVTSSEFHFYDCAAVVKSSENAPFYLLSCDCKWGCQWNTQDHICSDSDKSVSGSHIIRNQQVKSCPQFENPNPLLIPVGHKTPISFQGKNLDVYTDRNFKIGTSLMKQEEEMLSGTGSEYSFKGYEFAFDKTQEVNVSFHIKDTETDKKIDSTLKVVLYNCSVGREDCSLCKNADVKYSCVWCATTSSCVYQELCTLDEAKQCPAPKITDITPRFGPMNGNIAVTIRGSNLGIKKEDINRIEVAGEPCVHQEEKYSVSTSVVCKIGPVRRPLALEMPVEDSKEGEVKVELKDGRVGTSNFFFKYQNPKPKSVTPGKGPAAGGTVITISGTHLDTASKEDISISIGGVPCTVLSFGTELTCKTGAYKGQRIPSELLIVTLKYGKNTSIDVSDNTFQYSENPKMQEYSPRDSFVCGGRRITVSGAGFDLIQEVSMVVASTEDSPTHGVAFVERATFKNDSMLVFPSPRVNDYLDVQSLKTTLYLDNLALELPAFCYHSDPLFNNLSSTLISETSIISVTGRGFSKAMTASEAEAFVGDSRCNVTILNDDYLFLEAPLVRPTSRSRRQRRDTTADMLDLVIKFGNGEWKVGSVEYLKPYEVPLAIIIPSVIIPMLLFILVSVYCYRRKSQQAEREYEKVKRQLGNLEESVRERCKKEFTDLMIEMEDHTSDLSEARIPFLDYKTYTDRVFFLPSKDGANDVMITGKLDIPESRRTIVAQALNQFSNLLNSKTFLINFIRTLEGRPDFNARARVYFASLLTVALHGKLEYYTDIMRTLLLELMEEHVHSKNPKLMLRRSETVVERMLCNWMSICLYQFLKDTAGEPLYKLFKAIKHQVEKGPVDAKLKKAKYTLNDTGLLGDDVEYFVLTLQVLVHGEGPDVTPVKVLNCDTISQVKEKIIEQVYRNLPYSQRPKVESVALEWRPGSTGQILSDLDLTSQKEGRWRRLNTLAHYNVRDNATLVLSRVLHTQQSIDQNQDAHEERNALLEDDKVFHLVRSADDMEEVKSKRGSIKDKATTKAITEIYLTRLLSVKGTLQQFVDDFFRSVLCSGAVVPPAVKYFFDFLDEQAQKHDIVDEETIHIWKTNSLPLRFWVNILKNPHFIFDVHVTEVVDASLSVIAQTFMDACTKTEHKLSRESPSNKLLYAKEIPTYKKMVEDYYKGIRQMVQVSDQDMNTHLAEISRSHTDKLNTQVALHQLYQYASKYYDGIISSLDEDPAAQSRQLTLRLQQIAAALENKVTDL